MTIDVDTELFNDTLTVFAGENGPEATTEGVIMFAGRAAQMRASSWWHRAPHGTLFRGAYTIGGIMFDTNDCRGVIHDAR